MPKHREYEKVERWDHADEIDGINIGTVHISEKIDGANAQVFQDEEGYIHVGSRTRLLARAKNEEEWPFEIRDSFRGLPEYIFKNKKIRGFLKDNPDLRLYGEWLVKHTINYSPEFQNRFWIFDVFDHNEDKFTPFWDYYKWIEDNYGLDMIGLVDELENPSMEELLDMVRNKERIPKSEFGAETIEGLVFKNYAFVNRYGRCAYMKAVTQDFHEIHHTIMGANKYDDPEVYLISKYQPVARMGKIYNKLKDDHGILSMRNVPEFMERVLHDVITEDAWNMFMKDKKVRGRSFDMKALRKLSQAKSKNWLVAKLQEG